MNSKQLPDFINALRDPARYDHPVDEVRVIQTHISFVLIAGAFVYKFKKPVDFGFLDFTTLQKRGHFCERELILNRRLCPDIYLEQVSVTRDGASFGLNGTGPVVEYGIKMVRMPEERMMGRLIAANLLDKTHVDAIVATLVPFYERAEGGEAIRRFGRAEAVGVNVMENFEQTESFIGTAPLSRPQFDRISAYSSRILEDTARFDRRVDTGRIRDCHGDLYSANICLDRRVHIFDCIEFNERFRYSDIAADVAFLAMDLDYHGLDNLGNYFLNRFAEAADDGELLEITGFYKCYRAYVRGKIGLFTASDPTLDTRSAAAWSDQAKRYFALAERYAAAAQ